MLPVWMTREHGGGRRAKWRRGARLSTWRGRFPVAIAVVRAARISNCPHALASSLLAALARSNLGPAPGRF
jgi:hypothetical protein